MVRNSEDVALKYITDLYARECKDLEKARLSIDEAGLRKINISPAEGKLLYFLTKMQKPEVVIEVGTLSAYSTLWMAKALADSAKIYSFESDEKAFQTAKDNVSSSDFAEKIEIIFGDAHQNLADFYNGESNAMNKADMIFIDAEKKGYPKYLDWAENSLRKGGLIVADNTFLNGSVYGENEKTDKKLVNAMQDFNQRLADESKFDSVIIPTSEGLSAAIKKF